MRARQRHLNPSSAGAIVALDSRFISGLNDGDAVSSWNGRSGTSNNATQSNPTQCPLYRVNVQGGQPVVRFDGSNDRLVTPSINLAQPWTTICLTFPRQFRFGGFNSFFEGTNGNGVLIALSTFSRLAVFAGAQVNHGTTITLNSWYVATGSANGNSSYVVLNSAGKVTGAASTGALGGAMTLGSNWSATAFYDNDVALALTFNTTLADPLRRRFEHAAALSFKIACS